MKNDPCWKDYEMVGTKKKNGKEVPNCVPKEGIKEKSVSKAQQKFFGMVRAKQKGEMDNASPEVSKAAKSMTKKDVKDFASTKHKGLPVKKEEAAGSYSRYTASEIQKRRAEREKRNAGTTQAQRMKNKMYGNMMKKEEVESEGYIPGKKPQDRMTSSDKKTMGKVADMMRKEKEKKASMTKESVELEEKYEVVNVKSINDSGEDKAISYGRKKGYKDAGVIGDSPVKAMVLFHLKPEDKKDIKGANIKAGEQVFRYATRSTIAGDIFPLIKVNLDKGMAYFLTQESSSGEIDEVKFETKGTKLKFARMISGMKEDYNSTDFFSLRKSLIEKKL
jgi:hypothetical protein